MSTSTDAQQNSDRLPELSVILITPDSFETIRRTIGCLTRQSAHDRIELVIIAPTSANIEVDRALVAPLAGVQVVRLASLTPSGPARAAGIRAARAPVVAFGEEHCFPAPPWAQALIDAHRGDYAAVGPAMHNANPETIVSWADLLIGYGPWVAPVATRGARISAWPQQQLQARGAAGIRRRPRSSHGSRNGPHVGPARERTPTRCSILPPRPRT